MMCLGAAQPQAKTMAEVQIWAGLPMPTIPNRIKRDSRSYYQGQPAQHATNMLRASAKEGNCTKIDPTTGKQASVKRSLYTALVRSANSNGWWKARRQSQLVKAT